MFSGARETVAKLKRTNTFLIGSIVEQDLNGMFAKLRERVGEGISVIALITSMLIFAMPTADAQSDPELLVDTIVKFRTTDNLFGCRTKSWLIDAARLTKVRDLNGIRAMVDSRKCLTLLPLEEFTFFGLLLDNTAISKASYGGSDLYVMSDHLLGDTARVEKVD